MVEWLALRAVAPRRAARIATTDILTTVAKPPGGGTAQLTNLV